MGNKKYTDEQLIANLNFVAKNLKMNTVPIQKYKRSNGALCHAATIRKRFCNREIASQYRELTGWDKALICAGLSLSVQYVKEDIQKEIQRVYELCKPQPLTQTFYRQKENGRIDRSVINEHYGNFLNACHAAGVPAENKRNDKSPEQLIECLHFVAKKLKKDRISQTEYLAFREEYIKTTNRKMVLSAAVTIARAFSDFDDGSNDGGWNKALRAAGLNLVQTKDKIADKTALSDLSQDEQENPSSENNIITESVINSVLNYLETGGNPSLIDGHIRNPEAREFCIRYYKELYGWDTIQCFICGFKFGEKYGVLFEDKIHVHHKEMISRHKGEHEINAATDLIPVCPNCHMVLHSKKEGCYTHREVMNMIEKNKQ